MDAAWRRAIGRAWWIAVPLAFSAAVSLPITRNFFFGDDLLNLYLVVNRRLGELLLAPYGGHELFVRNALMAALYALFGAEPAAYCWTAVLTHLGNVVLLAVLIRDLTASPHLACFGATLWGTAPVTEGTIGWYAVYGHALATTALLVVLIRVVAAGRRGDVSAIELGAWALLLWAASTSFGVGLAFVLAMPAIAWLLLPAAPPRRRAVAWLVAVAAVVPILYVGAQHLAAALYGVRPQTPSLAATLRKWVGIIDLLANQIAFGTVQLLFGPFARFVTGWWWTAVAALPLAGVVAAALWRGTPAARRAMVAFLALTVATYGIIAAGRAPFYPQFKPALVRSDRYHYAAPLALAVLLCLAVAQLRPRRLTPPLRNAALAVWLTALGVALATVRSPVRHYEYARDLTAVALARLDEIIRAAPPGEDVYIANEVFRGVGPMVVNVPRNFPGLAALFTVYYPANVVDGRRVFFIEANERVRAAAADGLRSATLLVAPDDIPEERIRHVTAAPATDAAP